MKHLNHAGWCVIWCSTRPKLFLYVLVCTGVLLLGQPLLRSSGADVNNATTVVPADGSTSNADLVDASPNGENDSGVSTPTKTATSSPSLIPTRREGVTPSHGQIKPISDIPVATRVGPGAQDRHITRVVALLLRQQHLLNDPLDDDHARRGLDNFLTALDAMKVYFYQSDVDDFRADQNRLDDSLKRGDIRFAYKVFHRFIERVDERVAWIDQLLEMEHDFSIQERINKDPDAVPYLGDADEAFDHWRRRIKYDLLMLKADNIEDQEARDRLRRRYTSFSKRMRQTHSDELLEMYLTAMTTGFDPHTTFMSASTLEDFHIQMKLNLEGIGAALSIDDGYIVVTEVIAGGAADKHGKMNPDEKLEPEDRIIRVGQGPEGETVDVIDMKLRDVVRLIRGRSGTVVRLGVQSSGHGETQTYAITRAKIELKDKEAKGCVFDDGEKADGSPYRIGAIRLPSFYMDMSKHRNRNGKSTTRDVRRILDGFRKKEVDAVVVDLRRNGGGSLMEAIGITGLFIDRGPVVQVKDSIGNIQHYDDLDFGMAWSGPLVVLTSKFSASASEIFAGAIQDYRRGLVVGDSSTHGKGTVQSLLELGPKMFPIPNPRNCGALKITMQQFYRPNGDSTQARGVLADIVLPRITDHFDIAESDLDYALNFDRVPRARYEQFDLVNEDLIGQLRTLSVRRQEHSKHFQKANQRIEKYLEHKKRTTIPLNEEQFLAQRAEFDEEEEKEKPSYDHPESDLPIERDYYFEEVLDITVDYVRSLNGHHVARLN